MKSVYITTCDYSVMVTLAPPRDTTCPYEEVQISEEVYNAVVTNLCRMVEKAAIDDENDSSEQ